MLSPMRGEKFQRRVKWERKQKGKKRRKNTRHHNEAKSLGGCGDGYNIFMLSEEHHRAYHKLFGLRNFNQAIEVLKRLQEAHERRL